MGLVLVGIIGNLPIKGIYWFSLIWFSMGSNSLFGENFIFPASNRKINSSTKDLCLAKLLHKA